MEEEIYGTIERLTFTNAENGFTVAKLKEPRKKDLTCLVGVMPGLQPGETVRCRGTWKNNPHHGLQFEIAEIRCEVPADLVGIQRYLESGLIKGIGPIYAKRMVETFGLQTLDVIDKTPKRLREVPGIGKKRLDRIGECWHAQKSIRQVMLFLQQFGVSPAYAQRIYKTYGEESIARVRESPYHLARDVFGIGFKTADTLAGKMGIPKEDGNRIQAGIEFTLSTLSEEGHVCYPEEELIAQASALLEVSAPLIETNLALLVEEQRLKRALLEDRPFVWLKMLYACETGIAREIERLKNSPCFLRSVDEQKALLWVQEIFRLKLAPHQQEAVVEALKSKLLIITGGPGTGKSTITKAILAITEKLTSRCLLAAPTGRAAKRLSEITRRPAKTIHSLLEYDFKKGGFKRGRNYPLNVDLIIIDEASMIDTALMYQLLKAIPDTARVVFVGDINQLPSVGPGNVLKDLIASKQVPVASLTKIFRQAAGSKIIQNAHLINEGKFPYITPHPNSDFFFMEAEEPEEIAGLLVTLVQKRLPKKYGLHPIRDIQILAPMKRGPIGTLQLNVLLQEALNPSSQALFHRGGRFHVKDKVMQIRNNYDKEIYNGDVGIITAIDTTEQEVRIDFDGREVVYDFLELDEIVLAYAVSVHKYQGSECPCILMPVHMCHFMLLHRNLLYTGVTRGKRLVVLVGTKKALAIAVKNDEIKKRYTGLIDVLRKEITGY